MILGGVPPFDLTELNGFVAPNPWMNDASYRITTLFNPNCTVTLIVDQIRKGSVTPVGMATRTIVPAIDMQPGMKKMAAYVVARNTGGNGWCRITNVKVYRW
jgi:hypothetical protein